MADINQFARSTATVLSRIKRNAQPCSPERTLDGSLCCSPPDKYPDETLHRLIHYGVERIIVGIAS